MKRFLAVATVAMSLVCSAAFADTRGDFVSNPGLYGALSVNQALPNGQVIAYDIPVHGSLLAPPGAVPVAANGKVYATSIGYLARPISSLNTTLGMAVSPYAR
jgi:hypothetical protein